MSDWFRLFVVGAATSALLKAARNERRSMNINKCKSIMRSFLKSLTRNRKDCSDLTPVRHWL